MNLFETLFGKNNSELEEENRMLKRKLADRNNRESMRAPKKVLYQCRHCGYKSIRNATDGAPAAESRCPKHPRGWCKGPHSWQRTFL